MFDHPSSSDLIAAVRLYLEQTAMPALTGHAAFHGRVAVNVLSILERELALGPAALAAETDRLQALLGDRDQDLAGLRAKLCDAIDTGKITAQSAGVLDHLLATAADRVAIEQPNYASLKRVG
jgi:hypothetical protein